MTRDQALKILAEFLNRLRLNIPETYAASEAFKWFEEATAPKSETKPEPPK